MVTHKGGRDELQAQIIICLQIFTYEFFCCLKFLHEFNLKGLIPAGKQIGGGQTTMKVVCYCAMFELNSEKCELLKHSKQGNGMIRFVC